ncbi:hypothetical protein DUNSADRAFT_8660 [Dunaliella salina]|uniref:Uncharacterized protein n=1 Tax=Dunaliella salina TaxID=3046 RepID=A0ABQ7GJ36_DUNSA|nr:hypothetical protein DUNSADRAFT_8660 [Dunaliella salina]|eukprot:KAF5834619.1 hypothetical protein DUNSADRAFT_8660 [Dunaliella salina]
MGKAKPAKHTAAELKKKEADATTNKGGGKAGMSDRLGGDKGHAKFACHICKTTAPSLASMQIHHDAKHPKEPWEPEKCINNHADGPVYKGVAIRGSTKK